MRNMNMNSLVLGGGREGGRAEPLEPEEEEEEEESSNLEMYDLQNGSDQQVKEQDTEKVRGCSEDIEGLGEQEGDDDWAVESLEAYELGSGGGHELTCSRELVSMSLLALSLSLTPVAQSDSTHSILPSLLASAGVGRGGQDAASFAPVVTAAVAAADATTVSINYNAYNRSSNPTWRSLVCVCVCVCVCM